MNFTDKNNESNYYLEETSPGSGEFYICYKDATQFYRGLTYGFHLDIDDEVPEHFEDLLKPRMTYAAFDDNTTLSVREAIGKAHWEALKADAMLFFSKYELVKVGEAHIQLQRIA